MQLESRLSKVKAPIIRRMAAIAERTAEEVSGKNYPEQMQIYVRWMDDAIEYARESLEKI